MVEKFKLDILDVWVCKNIFIKEKCRVKIEDFLLKIGFDKSGFVKTFITFGFRCRIKSVNKLVVFGVNILLDTNTKILMIIELRN